MTNRIATFSHNLERNGSNRFLFLLNKHLASRCQVEVLSPSSGPLEEDYAELGVRVTVVPIRSDNYGEIVLERLEDADFAIVNTIIRADAVIAVAKADLPFLWVIHETWPLENIDHMMREVWKWSWPTKKTIQEAFERASTVIYPARVTRQCYAEYTQHCEVRTIYNGIELDSYRDFGCSGKRRRLRQDLQIGTEDIALLHVGSVNLRKNQLASVRAVAQLVRDGFRNLRLLLVGARRIRQHEIECLGEIERVIEEEEISDHVQIYPVQKDIRGFYCAADLLLCPSLSEVLPYVILEAMYFGVPSIASDIDGIPEVVKDGRTGLLIKKPEASELAAAIRMAIRDPESVTRMGKNCRELVAESFSYERMCRDYDALIQERIRGLGIV